MSKQAVVLNYSMMCSDIGMEVEEKVQFISRFFQRNPELNKDKDLLEIAWEFQAFLEAFKRLDTTINRVGEGLLK